MNILKLEDYVEPVKPAPPIETPATIMTVTLTSGGSGWCHRIAAGEDILGHMQHIAEAFGSFDIMNDKLEDSKKQIKEHEKKTRPWFLTNVNQFDPPWEAEWQRLNSLKMQLQLEAATLADWAPLNLDLNYKLVGDLDSNCNNDTYAV